MSYDEMAKITGMSEDEAIRREFKKSQEILDLRVEYYEKFSKVLSARQICEMYKIEREDLATAPGKVLATNSGKILREIAVAAGKTALKTSRRSRVLPRYPSG